MILGGRPNQLDVIARNNNDGLKKGETFPVSTGALLSETFVACVRIKDLPSEVGAKRINACRNSKK